jgi:hypothetical protein
LAVVLEEREKADRMAAYERQNASFRDEIVRIQTRRASRKVAAKA